MAGGEHPVVVACAFDPIEARLLTELLRAHGLSAYPVWHETLSNHWSMMLACGGIRITVPAPEVDQAVGVLNELPAAAPLRPRWRLIVIAAILSLPLLSFPMLPLRMRPELPARIRGTT